MLQCVAAAQSNGVLLQCVVVLSIYQSMDRAGSALLQCVAAISIYQCMHRTGYPPLSLPTPHADKSDVQRLLRQMRSTMTLLAKK